MGPLSAFFAWPPAGCGIDGRSLEASERMDTGVSAYRQERGLPALRRIIGYSSVSRPPPGARRCARRAESGHPLRPRRDKGRARRGARRRWSSGRGLRTI